MKKNNSLRRLRALSTFLLLSAVPLLAIAQEPAPGGAVAAGIATVVDGSVRPQIANALLDQAALKGFYDPRGHQPAWTGTDGQPTANALAALSLLNDAAADGLNPEAYHVSALQALAKPQTPVDSTNFELLLSDGLASYLHDEAVGRIPVGPDRDPTFPANFDKVAQLNAVAPLGADDLKKLVDGLRPTEPDYAMLRQTLANLRGMQSQNQGWQPLPDGPSLKPGMKNAVVPALRVRLGVAPVAGPDANKYDDQIAGAVQAFQQTHAIKDDGTLGHDTRAALNVPLDARIAEVIAAMERWRWLPHDLRPRYVMDNVGGFWTRYFDNGKMQFQLPIIVGREERETPLLIATIDEVVLNPSWTVPPTIIKKDVLPGLRRDPNYLESKHLKLYRRTEDGLEEVSAANYHGGSDYILRQPPGEENPLGQYKLQFQNRFSIYMHDTDEKKKFTAALRTFSSGCIRVQNVRQLVDVLLAGQLTGEQIDAFVATEKTKTIKLDRPLPVYIDYFSVWDDGQGHTIFGPDLYGKDVDLAAAIQATNRS